MVFAKALSPGAILVVIPVVIILVALIVDSDLHAHLLRYGMAMIVPGAAMAALRNSEAM